ncbi:MAG: 4-hydroxythreonine-4-phosphate dehydrogenase PdxA, partial [Raoultibacter sp.]
TYGQPEVLNQDLVDMDSLELGKVQTQGGRAAYMAVEKVIQLAMAHEIDATVTGPLNKEAMNLAGFHYSGHTEIYAALTGTKDYAMMLVDGPMRVVHVSTHVPLRVACDRCTTERVLRVIRLAYSACRKLGIAEPRIAVAGLNPHAGESGLFGREEIEELQPAIELAQREGMRVDGPLPADTVFSKMNGGMYDIVVAQFHDQGHIPLKVLGFRMNPKTGAWDSVTGVNITLGLPIIRSSVDHGTAFDQAGKGCANESSMRNAIEYGAKLAMMQEQ